jgi:hypothetical protein
MADGVNNEPRIAERATNETLARVGRPGRFIPLVFLCVLCGKAFVKLCAPRLSRATVSTA